MRRLLVFVLLIAACQSATPPSTETVETPATTPEGTVFVTASTLNVRREPSANADVIAQVRRGDKVSVIESTQGWVNVRLNDDRTGWVSAKHVSATAPVTRTRRGCPPDSDFRFATTPTPDLRPTEKHGLVVVDATVDVTGKVLSTRIVSNGTDDADLAKQAEREIRSAKFVAPVRDCAPRTFIFTYKRTF